MGKIRESLMIEKRKRHVKFVIFTVYCVVMEEGFIYTDQNKLF